ncbi:unnamed protein product [Penicillium salamii]|uniref:Six-bladed beta-propeller, TolB-like protein n=1 Tax=Penicillium salamii TaxID=1612424 RepID=A0A9W4JYX1_9EURO|nr:unnamed protein product [Penicillium salamii]
MAAIVRFLIFLIQILPALGSFRSPNIRELYRFPNGTWLENIAVRPNGNLLIADATTSSLWEIKPSTDTTHSSPNLIHRFEAETVGGIAELAPDTYAVIVSNSVWRIDLSQHAHILPPVRIADIIPAGFLNGVAALDEGNSVVISDSELGLVWYLNIQSGNYSILHRHETMKANSDLGILIGVNGLKILHDYMYYSNSPKQIFCRIRIDTRTGRALGPYEVISHDTLADDFAVDPWGIGYLASPTNNEIIKVYPDGFHEVVAGSKNSRELMSVTAAAFGRTQSDRHVLYVTTGGETEHAVNTTASLGGKVMAVLVDS